MSQPEVRPEVWQHHHRKIDKKMDRQEKWLGDRKSGSVKNQKSVSNPKKLKNRGWNQKIQAKPGEKIAWGEKFFSQKSSEHHHRKNRQQISPRHNFFTRTFQNIITEKSTTSKIQIHPRQNFFWPSTQKNNLVEKKIQKFRNICGKFFQWILKTGLGPLRFQLFTPIHWKYT